jgi:hypothetical protein
LSERPSNIKKKKESAWEIQNSSEDPRKPSRCQILLLSSAATHRPSYTYETKKQSRLNFSDPLQDKEAIEAIYEDRSEV